MYVTVYSGKFHKEHDPELFSKRRKNTVHGENRFAQDGPVNVNGWFVAGKLCPLYSIIWDTLGGETTAANRFLSVAHRPATDNLEMPINLSPLGETLEKSDNPFETYTAVSRATESTSSDSVYTGILYKKEGKTGSRRRRKRVRRKK